MTLRKTMILLALLLLALPVMAQDNDPVNPAEVDFSGTPEEICEAATPAVDPESRVFEQADDVLEDWAEARVAHVVACRPELCTLDCGTMNFAEADYVMTNTPGMLREMARRMTEAGVRIEIEAARRTIEEKNAELEQRKQAIEALLRQR